MVVVPTHSCVRYVVVELPPWKIVAGLIFIAVLAWILFQLIGRTLVAFEEIAGALWMMTLTLFGVVTFVAITGVCSRADLNGSSLLYPTSFGNNYCK